jgi:hypothetical protein
VKWGDIAAIAWVLVTSDGNDCGQDDCAAAVIRCLSVQRAPSPVGRSQQQFGGR